MWKNYLEGAIYFIGGLSVITMTILLLAVANAHVHFI